MGWLTKTEKAELLLETDAELGVEGSIAWMDYQKTWRGKLSKLRHDFVQSLNPKYVKEQRAKRRAEREQYKTEIKEAYGMSDAEVEETLKLSDYLNSWRGRLDEKLWNFGQEIKMRYFPKKPQEPLTNDEIEALLAGLNGKKDNTNTQDDGRVETRNADSGREM